MGLRDELAGLDDLGRAAAIVTWATGMPATTPCTTSNVGGPPTLTSAFFVPLPGTLKLDLLGAGFEVEGSDRETRPGKRAYEVRDDGSVWTHLGGERAQVHEASVSVLLLETVLHWIRLHAPASLQLEVETAERLRDYAQQFELLHLSVNRRLDLAVFSWLAGKNIVGFLREGDAAGRVPTVELLGPSRSAVEAEQGRGGIVYGWASVERAMEPETDRWSPPNAPFPGGHSRAVSDLDDILGEADGVRALERFLAAWYGVELPQATEADERPVALARLAQVSNIADLFRDGHLLLEESDRSAAVGGLQRDHPDAVPAWAECQYLTIAGYVPDRDDPTVVFTHDVPGGELTQPAIHPTAPLGRFLLRALIDEAIFHSPVCVSTSYVEAEEVDRILADMTVAIPGIDRWSPVWTDGRVLTVVHRHERSGIAAAPQVHIAAHRRSDVVESPAGRLPRLAWSYADDSRGDHRPFGVAPDKLARLRSRPARTSAW